MSSRNIGQKLKRELTTLKFSLAIQADKLYRKPHIPLLEENNVRRGFFDEEQVTHVVAHLPDPLDGIVRFAFITGWRIPSEVLPLEWRHVDFNVGQVRLDAGTTTNGEGRVIPMTRELRQLLEERRRAADELKRTRGLMVPHVFFRMVANRREGEKSPRKVTAFNKAWGEHVRRPDAPAVSRTTCDGVRCETLCGLASLSGLGCR